MIKLAHLLVLSVLIIWLAGSGCIENDTSDVNEAGMGPNSAEAGISGEDAELTQAEIQELDTDMAELEDLLENASPEEEIVIEEL